MPKNKIILSLGFFIALLPILGFPNSWEMFFQVLVGLSIVAITFWTSIDKKLTMKAKAAKRQAQRRMQELQARETEVLEPQAPGMNSMSNPATSTSDGSNF